jgi:hypothetical protein
MTLENAPRSAIEVCHFIPKATKASEVGSGLLLIACSLTLSLAQLLALEYNTGLTARTLNVNTVQNLDFCELFHPLPLTLMFNNTMWPTVRADLHRSFNRNAWILIPSTDVLARIEERIQSFVQKRDGGAETSSGIYDEVNSRIHSSAFKWLIET